MKDIFEQTAWDMIEHHIAGTRVFINSDGFVEIQRLTVEECRKFVEDNENGIPFPKEVIIADLFKVLT